MEVCTSWVKLGEVGDIHSSIEAIKHSKCTQILSTNDHKVAKHPLHEVTTLTILPSKKL